MDREKATNKQPPAQPLPTMDLSAKLSMTLAVQSLIEHDALGTDLYISAFAAAVGSAGGPLW
jgi:hypothetical protein